MSNVYYLRVPHQSKATLSLIDLDDVEADANFIQEELNDEYFKHNSTTREEFAEDARYDGQQYMVTDLKSGDVVYSNDKMSDSDMTDLDLKNDLHAYRIIDEAELAGFYYSGHQENLVRQLVAREIQFIETQREPDDHE